MSRKSKLLALLTMSFLLAILVPAAAYAAPQPGELAAQTLQAQGPQLASPSDVKATVTANDDGTFELVLDYSRGSNDANDIAASVALYDGRERISIKPSDCTYSKTVFNKIPTEYASKTITAKLSFVPRNPNGVWEESPKVSKKVTLPEAVVRTTVADLKKLANKKVTTTKTKYGGDLKVGTKVVVKHGLYTLTMKVTKIEGGTYTIKATIKNKAIVQEPFDSNYIETFHYTIGEPTLNDGSERFSRTGAYASLVMKESGFDKAGLTESVTYEIDKSACKAGWNKLVIPIEAHNLKGLEDESFTFKFTQPLLPPAVDVYHGASAKVTKSSLVFDVTGRNGTAKYQYRKVGAKKWSKTKVVKNDSITLKGLKGSTKYQVRLMNVMKSEGQTFKSEWSSPYTIRTAPSVKPVIASVSHGAVSTSRYWQHGYWTSYTSSGRWIPGRYVTSSSSTVTVKLAKKIKGAVGYEVKYGRNTLVGKFDKDGRTITFSGGASTIDIKVRVFVNDGYYNELAGYSKWSAAKTLYY